MKPFLAFDTSTDTGSVALGAGGSVIASSTLTVRSAHSERMLPAIRDLLGRAGVSIGQLEAVVIGAGPGSFTGLRIGAALAKGLCFAGRLPLYAYSSLSAIVAGLSIAGRICAMSDARAERVFAATFASARPVRRLSPPRRLELRDLIAELEPLEEWTFGGDAAIKHSDLLREHGARIVSADATHPRAEGLLWLQGERPEGRVEDVLAWEPDYLLPSAAERATAS